MNPNSLAFRRHAIELSLPALFDPQANLSSLTSRPRKLTYKFKSAAVEATLPQLFYSNLLLGCKLSDSTVTRIVIDLAAVGVGKYDDC
jgi:hypothetical protein